MYMANSSPKNRSTNFVVSQAVMQKIKTQSLDSRQLKLKKDPFANKEYGNQTFTHSIKTRQIIKNNYGMPHITNKKFLPVNKTEAKDTIFRNCLHVHEVDEFITDNDVNKSRFAGSKNESIKIRDNNSKERRKNESELLSNLNNSAFAQKLDNMEKRSH